MSELTVNPGDTIPLSVVLWDRDVSKFVRARIYDSTDTEITGSPVTLSHVADGLYTAAGPAMPSDTLSIVYDVFDNAGLTTLSVCHLPGTICVYPSRQDQILTKVCEIIARLDNVLGSLNSVDVEISKQEIECVLDDLGTVVDIITEEPTAEIEVQELGASIVEDELTAITEKCE